MTENWPLTAWYEHPNHQFMWEERIKAKGMPEGCTECCYFCGRPITGRVSYVCVINHTEANQQLVPVDVEPPEGSALITLGSECAKSVKGYLVKGDQLTREAGTK